MMVDFDVVLTEDEETGMWIATVPSLHACHTQGASPDEALARVPDVMALCLEDARLRHNK